jgi:hypothetical protein
MQKSGDRARGAIRQQARSIPQGFAQRHSFRGGGKDAVENGRDPRIVAHRSGQRDHRLAVLASERRDPGRPFSF